MALTDRTSPEICIVAIQMKIIESSFSSSAVCFSVFCKDKCSLFFYVAGLKVKYCAYVKKKM